MGSSLRGNVAALINNRELVINLGSEDGVQIGMKFAVLNRNGLEVFDPTTGEKIGTVEIPKVVVEAIRVDKKLTVARTFHRKQRNVGGSNLAASGIVSMFQPPKWVNEWETFKTEQKPHAAELSEEDSYVKIGDPVVVSSRDEWLVDSSELTETE